MRLTFANVVPCFPTPLGFSASRPGRRVSFRQACVAAVATRLRAELGLRGGLGGPAVWVRPPCGRASGVWFSTSCDWIRWRSAQLDGHSHLARDQHWSRWAKRQCGRRCRPVRRAKEQTAGLYAQKLAEQDGEGHRSLDRPWRYSRLSRRSRPRAARRSRSSRKVVVPIRSSSGWAW